MITVTVNDVFTIEDTYDYWWVLVSVITIILVFLALIVVISRKGRTQKENRIEETIE